MVVSRNTLCETIDSVSSVLLDFYPNHFHVWRHFRHIHDALHVSIRYEMMMTLWLLLKHIGPICPAQNGNLMPLFCHTLWTTTEIARFCYKQIFLGLDLFEMRSEESCPCRIVSLLCRKNRRRQDPNIIRLRKIRCIEIINLVVSLQGRKIPPSKEEMKTGFRTFIGPVHTRIAQSCP
jgi:hypothetical protein